MWCVYIYVYIIHTHTHIHISIYLSLSIYLSICIAAVILVTNSCLSFVVTPWTIAFQAPLFMGFPRQEYWSGCHCLLWEIFLTQGSNLQLLHWQVDSLPLSHQGGQHVCICIDTYTHAHAHTHNTYIMEYYLSTTFYYLLNYMIKIVSSFSHLNILSGHFCFSLLSY